MFLRDLFFFFFIVIGLSSCSNSDLCLSNQHAVQLGFYSARTSTASNDKDSVLTDVSIYGLGKTDSVYESKSINKVFLPLSFANDPDTTSFIIRARDYYDTISFVHSKELDYISGDCGYIFKFSVDTVLFTTLIIDSVAIAYPKINYGEDIENVKVYIY
ncbi:MAG: hypothetical protein JW717_03105 [Marinilabiliaceae bacterium]|nr:hypothetical protein [Marinilabiliaceae bacterium]